MRDVDTIIIGGGISGATALHRLASAGNNVLLLERENALGGAMRSHRTSTGALIERGPNTIQSGNEHVEQLLHELNLSEQIIEADKQAANRYVVRNGKLVPVPGNPRSLIESSLFSGRAKLRLLREPFIGKGAEQGEESVAEFVRRRLGREPLDYGVNPFVSGIYAGDPERLSLRHAFPTLYDLEQNYGSLIRGGVRKMKERKKAAGNPAQAAPRKKRRMFSLRDGIASLPQAVGTRWPDNVLVGCSVTSLSPDGDGWTVHASCEGVEQDFRARELILATSAPVAADLVGGFDGELARVLRGIEYPPVAVVSMTCPASDVDHPLDGFGVLCPQVENRQVLGVIFTSSIFPERTPEGSALLTVFAGGARQPELALLPENDLSAIVRSELQDLLGIRSDVQTLDITVWKQAIPQYNCGYGEVLEGLQAAEGRHPGLHLLGNYRGGISVPDCIQSGWMLGEKIAGKNP